MTLKPVAPIFGLAAVVVLAIAVYLQLAPNVGTGDTLPTATATANPSPQSSPSPAARLITVADLPDIVLTGDRIPSDWEQGGTKQEPSDIVVYPTRSTQAARQSATEVDSLLGGFASEYAGPDAVYICWAAVFATEADAERALAIYEADFASPRGWGLEQTSSEGPNGIEGAFYAGTTSNFLPGPAGSDPDPAHVRLWRVGNLLLVLAASLSDDNGGLHLIGDNMVARARHIAAGDPL